jgi:hypothetical protein
MSERAQVELDYSARMEALGRKYSNSITAAAQNPLLTHSATHAHTASTQGAVNDAAKASKTGKTPSKPTPAAVTPGPVTPTVPLSASAVSRSFHTITSLGGVLSASKPTAGAEAVNTPGSPEEEDPELDNPVGRHRTARAGNLRCVEIGILRPFALLYGKVPSVLRSHSPAATSTSPECPTFCSKRSTIEVTCTRVDLLTSSAVPCRHGRRHQRGRRPGRGRDVPQPGRLGGAVQQPGRHAHRVRRAHAAGMLSCAVYLLISCYTGPSCVRVR